MEMVLVMIGLLIIFIVLGGLQIFLTKRNEKYFRELAREIRGEDSE